MDLYSALTSRFMLHFTTCLHQGWTWPSHEYANDAEPESLYKKISDRTARAMGFQTSSVSYGRLPHIDISSLTPGNYIQYPRNQANEREREDLFPPAIKMRFRWCDYKWSAETHYRLHLVLTSIANASPVTTCVWILLKHPTLISPHSTSL